MSPLSCPVERSTERGGSHGHSPSNSGSRRQPRGAREGQGSIAQAQTGKKIQMYVRTGFLWFYINDFGGQLHKLKQVGEVTAKLF